MKEKQDLLAAIREAASRRLLFLPHAVRQMARPDRMIAAAEVRAAIETGEVIEDYPEDVRGHSGLVLGLGANRRPIHVVCAPKEDFIAIITAYVPDPQEWDASFRKRVSR